MGAPGSLSDGASSTRHARAPLGQFQRGIVVHMSHWNYDLKLRTVLLHCGQQALSSGILQASATKHGALIDQFLGVLGGFCLRDDAR